MTKSSIFLRKVIAIVAICLAANFSAYAQHPPLGGGDGSSGNPYQITTPAHLKSLSDYVNGGGTNNVFYKLMNDLDLSAYAAGTGWQPIGNNPNYFTGTFDGNGKKITGLKINRPSENYIGLFGATSGATIKDLGIDDCDVTGRDNVGGLVGRNYKSSISNCYTMGNVTGNGEVGGLVGNNSVNSSISNCYATGNITGTGIYHVGGLVGDNGNNSSITNCYATGNVTGKDWVGGLVGENNSSTITNCYAIGEVTGTGEDVGGLVGINFNKSSIENCYATGEVTGTGIGKRYVGGLVGQNYNSSIENCYATGNVTGNDWVGGLVGYNEKSSITNCYATGEVTGTGDDVGGLVGYNYYNSSISNCYAIGEVTGKSANVGGLVGSNGYNSSITNCVAANASVTGTGSNVNRIAGNNESDATLTNNHALKTMMVNGSPLTSTDADSKNGADADLATLQSLVFYQTTLTWDIAADDSKIWKICDGDDYPFLSWEGKSCSAIEIYTAEDLNNVRNNLSGNYILMNDLDLSSYAAGEGWQPIGNNPNYFTGTFDGNGHKITGLKINRPTNDLIGLFGYAHGATIKNLGIEDGDITGKNAVGGLVGYNDNKSSISNCYATGKVTGDYNVGGLVGENSDSSISNCYATGEVTGKNTVGGLVGLNWNNSSISNCYATGEVTGTWAVGGLVGYNYINSSISNCVAANASVTGNTNVNRIFGYDDGVGIFTNNYALETMLVNGSTVTSTDADSKNGADADLSTLQSLVFYKTTLTWDIAADDSKIWKICDGDDFPFLSWEGKSCFDIIEIYTAEDLNNVRNKLSKNYILMNDIDLSAYAAGAGWKPIGPFTGTFDGNGHKIIGLTINRPSENFIGLFGATDGAIIKNLGIEDCDVIGNYYVGGLVGSTNDNSSISNCYATGKVTGTWAVGGLVGRQQFSCFISNCYATGIVTGTENQVGGLVGSNSTNSTIENCYATGNVTGVDWVGGLVGYNNNTSSISNCYATSDVTGKNRVGGLVGYNYKSSISNCYATSNVTGNGERVGGLVGWNTESSISNCYATGEVTGTGEVGGLVGLNFNKSSIENCYATANVEGNTSVGGLVGTNTTGSSISNCYATGNVTGNDRIGGLVGYNEKSSISNCYATGIVTGIDWVGGLVGYNYENSSISNCVAANASVTGTGSNVNRIVGWNDGTLTKNYALETMSVNGSTITSTDADSEAGADASLATLQSLVFYQTTLKWDVAADDTKTWKICEKDEVFPFLTWENKSCSGVGIEAPPSPPEGGDVRVYPNPTKGILIIDGRDAINRVCTSIAIFDVMGRRHEGTNARMHEGEKFPSFGGAGVVLDISHLPTGIYFLRIQTENGVVTKKVIKQ